MLLEGVQHSNGYFQDKNLTMISVCNFNTPKCIIKVEKILKGSLFSIPSPSPSVKIQITGGKVCLRCKVVTF